MGDSQKNLSSAYAAVLFVGGLSLVIGLIAVLFEVQFLQRLGLGWSSIIFGCVFLILARYTKQGSMLALGFAIGLYSLDGILFLSNMIQMKQASVAGGIVFRVVMIWMMARGIGAIREISRIPPRSPVRNPISSVPSQTSASTTPTVSMTIPSSGIGPKPVSFVAPSALSIPPEGIRPDMLSKSLTPEIINLRFVAYRCEIGKDHFRAIYQNASQRELRWFEITSLVIRQLPFQAPWEGKLILDIVPAIVAGERIQPVRVLSSTFVNYGFLPQGQSAATKENIRRLANFILSQNQSIFIDPGTDYFVHAGQPPVRFLSMSQFTEYDSRYG